jgi:hypothetical protein
MLPQCTPYLCGILIALVRSQNTLEQKLARWARTASPSRSPDLDLEIDLHRVQDRLDDTRIADKTASVELKITQAIPKMHSKSSAESLTKEDIQRLRGEQAGVQELKIRTLATSEIPATLLQPCEGSLTITNGQEDWILHWKSMRKLVYVQVVYSLLYCTVQFDSNFFKHSEKC